MADNEAASNHGRNSAPTPATDIIIPIITISSTMITITTRNRVKRSDRSQSQHLWASGKERHTPDARGELT